MALEIVNWTTSATATGEYSASVNLVDTTGEYSCGNTSNPFKGKLIRAGADVSSSVVEGDLSEIGQLPAIEPEPSLSDLSGTPIYVNGLSSGPTLSTSTEGTDISVNVVSCFNFLSGQSVNSHHQVAPARTAMVELMEIYAGYDSSSTDVVFDFSETSDVEMICGPVAGDNLYEQLQLIAFVGKSTLFIDERGVLRTGAWKDHTSDVDVRIPKEIVQRADKARAPDRAPTRLKVNGCFNSALDKGLRPALFGGRGGGGGGAPQPPRPGEPSAQNLCYSNGLPSSFLDFFPPSLLGGPADFRNIQYTITDNDGNVYTAHGIDPRSQKGAIAKISAVNGWANFATANLTVDARVGQRYPAEYNQSFQFPKNINGAINPYKAWYEGPMSNVWAWPQSMPLGASMGYVSGTEDFDGQDPGRRQLYLSDTCLTEEFGYVDETLDNVYAYCEDQLFDIAKRRFQETRLVRNTWTVQIPLMPGITMNDVVRFVTPDNCVVSGCEITGLVVGIATSYDATTGEASQTLTVADFSELGQCEYCAENLAHDPYMLGVGVWYKSYTGTPPIGESPLATYSVSYGGVYLVGGNMYAEIEYEQPCTTIGRIYDLSFDYDGTGSYTLKRRNGSTIASDTLSGIGTETIPFTATVSDGFFLRWKADVGDEITITNMRLTCCETA